MSYINPILINVIMEERLAEAEQRRRVRALGKRRGLLRRRHVPFQRWPID